MVQGKNKAERQNPRPAEAREHLQWHKAAVTRVEREARRQHKSLVVWFTGLSGSGKSTLAHAVEQQLHQSGCHTFVLDGDNIRHGLCADLNFTPQDRAENIRRIGEVSKLFLDAGIITLTAFISPYREDRQRVKALFLPEDFIEIYCQCPLAVCEQRDVKGLYQKARQGIIPAFTGISAPYEAPAQPDLICDTHQSGINACVNQVMALLRDRGVFS